MQRVIQNWKSPLEFKMPDGIFRPNGEGRQYLSYEEDQFRVEAFNSFGLLELYPEPVFKNFIGNHYADGAAVHEHMDRAPIGYTHTRCNWMIKKPVKGGDPIINGNMLSVKEGDLWICLASREFHSSTPIETGERIICSFGALIKDADIDKLNLDFYQR